MAQPTKVQLLTIKQVADQLGVCTKTIRRQIARQLLRHHRVGRTIRVSSEDLRAYVNSIRQ